MGMEMRMISGLNCSGLSRKSTTLSGVDRANAIDRLGRIISSEP